jgi:hypothetical protein
VQGLLHGGQDDSLEALKGWLNTPALEPILFLLDDIDTTYTQHGGAEVRPHWSLICD